MSDQPIPAATLIVVADRSDAPADVLMVERSDNMAFAAGALVFPGGRIDDADEVLGQSLGMSGAAVAAIRETIEETALPVGLAELPGQAEVRAMQRALVDGAPFADVLARFGLMLDRNALIPFARWVPRFHAVRRFDTMFFLTRAPLGDWPLHVIEGECAGATWIGAQAALEQERAKLARLIFPTRRTLERIALHRDFEALAADAREHEVEPVTPWVEEREGKRFIAIPDHLGFPVTSEKLDGLWRG